MGRPDSPAYAAPPPTVLDEESAPSTEDMIPPPGPTVAEAPASLTAVQSSTHYDPIDGGAPSSAPASSMKRSWSGPPPSMEEDPLIGTTLCETYTIRRLLGEGGMGRVYLADHTRIANKRFAIKTLHPEFARKREVISRFKREAEATASLSNPHIVGVYDVDRTPDGRPFLVAEYLDGEELGDLLDRMGKLDVPQAVSIVRQVCKGLAAAHDKGIVHRDVKPENVFLVGDAHAPMAKVLDFGISRLAEAGDGGTNLTKTGMVIGTPAYMSPEQARGERVDHRADIYAVGAILYTALTGQIPFDRDDPAAVVVAVLTQEPERPRAIEPSIPEHLEFVIQKAMAREPEDRYQSMRELEEALAPYDPKERSPTVAGGLAVQTTLPDDDALVRDARPLLVTWVAASLLSLVVGLVTTTAAVMRLAGAQLSPVETAVILVGGGLGLITPLVLIARHVKRVAWNSSVRAVEMLLALQRPLIIAGCTYGFAALFARFVHHVLFPSAVGVASPLWDVLLFGAAVAAGALVALLGRRAKRKQGAAGRAAPLPHPFALSMLLVAMIGTVVIYPVTMEREGEGASEGVSVPGLPFIVIGGNGAKVDEEVPDFSSRDRATTDELEKAKTEGTDALAALSERYPKDPVVVKALMLEQAKISKGLPAALRTAEKYMAMRKQGSSDADVKRVLLKAIDTGGDAAEQAFAIMATKMGSEGPDLIYAVLESRPPRRNKAIELLSKPEVEKLATPALRIAFDLYRAKGCKVELLGRAEKDGDERSAKLLRPLLIAPRRGCGFLGMQACPPRCPADEVAIRKAVKAIDARSSK